MQEAIAPKECQYEKYVKLAYKIASRWYERGAIEYDEAKSLAHCGLAKAINSKTYDPAKSKFTTYLGVCIDNEVRMYLNKENKYKSNTLFFSHPVKSNEWDTQELGDTLHDFRIEMQRERWEDLQLAQAIINDAMSRLSPVKREAFILWVEGKTQPQIAKLVGKTQSHVSRILKSVIAEIRKEVKKHG